MKHRQPVFRILIAFSLCAFLILLWIRSYWAIDTLSYHDGSPSSLSISSDHGTLSVQRSTRVTASDRTLRYWHGHDPIETDPNGQGIGGFHHYSASSGSWTYSAPTWIIAGAMALYVAHLLRRRRQANDEEQTLVR